jgi:hypothetical protein
MAKKKDKRKSKLSRNTPQKAKVGLQAKKRAVETGNQKLFRETMEYTRKENA